MTWLNYEKRIRKLETRRKIDDRIAIYVDDETQLPTRIAELIAVGALAEADRQRRAFYLKIRDAVALRLKAQKDIWTPCATWPISAETQPATRAGASAEQPVGDGATTGAC